MRAGLFLVVAVLLGHDAMAQVNQGALDALTAPKPAPRPAPRPAQPRPTEARPAEPRATAPRQAAKPPTLPLPPAVPTVPPAIAALPPPIVVPVAKPQPPPIVPVAADAPGEAASVTGGVRATFGADRSDLNPATEEAIRTFARGMKEGTAAINVLAYAAGSANDPSTPRRLSLARALAARAVLINEGIISTRIYVRALGVAGGEGPPNRVDVTAEGRS